jgi:hypothetical protein
VKSLSLKFSLAFLFFISTAVSAKVMSCINLLDTNPIQQLSYEDKISPKLQSTKAGNWEPAIVASPTSALDYVRFSFKKSEKLVEKDRIRIQINLYDLPVSTDKVNINFKFKFTDELRNFLLSDNAIKWLTIFEIWNVPGWQDKLYPFRISLNLYKNAHDHFLTPIISGELKNNISGVWEPKWKQSINIAIYSDQIYSFNASLNLSEDNSFEIKLSGGKGNEHERFIRKGDVVIGAHATDRKIWGINPIKLYTSPDILDRIEKANAKLELIFYNPQVCLAYTLPDYP